MLLITGGRSRRGHFCCVFKGQPSQMAPSMRRRVIQYLPSRPAKALGRPPSACSEIFAAEKKSSRTLEAQEEGPVRDDVWRCRKAATKKKVFARRGRIVNPTSRLRACAELAFAERLEADRAWRLPHIATALGERLAGTA